MNLTQGTYRFTQSDSSNSGHPFRFYLDDAKGTAFTTGVTTNGTAGSSGAYTQIVVDDTTPFTLSYQCSSHAFMGSYVHVGGTTTILGQTIDSDSNTITNIANADIKSNAAIALSKLAGGTANRALETSGTGALQASAVTTTELAVLDGGTSASTVTLADADRVVVNDDGDMKQVALTAFETYFESALDTLSNVTTVGALNAGSITSGFGSINNGSSAITTTGNLSGGTVIVGSSDHGTVKSNGNFDLVMQTGNSSTGSITITDGANGAITLDPHGTGTVDMSSARVTSVADPTGDQDAATKAYVDATSNGLDVKASVDVATTADLDYTYSNGSSGVGATLTNTANGVVALDGINLTANMRVLVKDQADTVCSSCKTRL